MIYECAITGTLLSIFIRTEYLRSKQLDLEENIKKKIIEEGIYHFTSKENATKIMESEYIAPTNGVGDNHFAKSRYGDNFAQFVYMFAGKPNANELSQNVAYKGTKDGTFYAIKYTPDKFELENFTQRLIDGAITYEGRLDIPKDQMKMVRFKIEKGKVCEIPIEEQVKTSMLHKGKISKIANNCKLLEKTLKTSLGTLRWKDSNKKLKACKEKRQQENKIIAQFNDETQIITLEGKKDGKVYTFTSMGTKMQDGKILTGFRMKTEGSKTEKNIFLDAINIHAFSEEKLTEFLMDNMNEEKLISEYIGKPVIKAGEITQVIDDEFKQHFYKKQDLAMKNSIEYQKYLASLKHNKTDRLIIWANNYLKSTVEGRKKIFACIKQLIKDNNKCIEKQTEEKNWR
ncbi:MAG: hypothetical protein IJV31_10220 [Clostridia bacterium]|nr:hypothetical protein [Clostridia bacterium]